MPPKETSNALNARDSELVVAWVKSMDSKPTVSHPLLLSSRR